MVELILGFLLLIALVKFVEKNKPKHEMNRLEQCPPFGPLHEWYRDPKSNDNLRCRRCNRTWAEIIHDA